MPVGQIFVFEVEDGRAGGWLTELAVRAGSPAEAYRTLRDGGLRKSQFTAGSRPSTASLEDLGCVDLGPRGVAMRSYEDGGWTPWTPVPVGYSLNWRDSGDVRLRTPVAGSYRRPRPGA